jgi:beta-xylosidase
MKTSKQRSAVSLVLTLAMLFGVFHAYAAPSIGSSDGGDGTYNNPVIWADVPDVDVIRVDDAYYMISTTMHLHPGAPIMKSYDLVNWEIVNYVYDILEDGPRYTLENGPLKSNNDYGKGQWAAAIRFNKGTYYVSFVSNTSGRTYIFATEDIENGPWRKTTLSSVYHDMSILFDDDDRVYMVYGNNNIRIVELNASLTAIVPGTDRVLISNAISNMYPSSGGSLGEGSHIYKIGGKYYVFLIMWPSQAAPNNKRTQICYRADGLDGPYEGKIVLNSTIQSYGWGGGVAQGGIVDTPDGDWYAMLFQDHGAVGRIPVLLPVTWTDGWPMMGVDGVAPAIMDNPNPGQEIKSIFTSDEFYQTDIYKNYWSQLADNGNPANKYNGSNLPLEWQWNHNPDNRYWSLLERPGYLRIRTNQIATCLQDARNSVSQRTLGPLSSATIALDVSGMKNGDVAGLSLFSTNYGYIAVKKTGNSNEIVMVTGNQATAHTSTQQASVPLNQNRVYFKVDGDFNYNQDRGRYYYSLDGVRWMQLGTVQAMTYNTTLFMGHRFQLFNYATVAAGGYVDFDYYRVDDKNTGDTAPANILNAGMSDVTAEPSPTTDIQLTMDALPAGQYKGISASVSIPKGVEVVGVAFNDGNITGTTSFTYKNGRLQLFVSGDNVYFANDGSKLFATLKLNVDKEAAEGVKCEVRVDYIKAEDDNIVYNAHDAFVLIQDYDPGNDYSEIAESIAASEESITLNIGQTKSFTVLATFTDGHAEYVTNDATYASSNPAVCTAENGVVSGRSPGNAAITVTYTGPQGGTVTDTVSVTVLGSKVLLSHPFATLEDYNAVVDGYVVRISTYADRRIVSYDETNRAMRFEAQGLWTSGGFKYDITDIVSSYPAGTEFTLSMDVSSGPTSVIMGFLYDNNTNTNQGSTFGVTANVFTTITGTVALRTYSNRVYLFVYNGDPVVLVRDAVLSVGVVDKTDEINLGADGKTVTAGIANSGDIDQHVRVVVAAYTSDGELAEAVMSSAVTVSAQGFVPNIVVSLQGDTTGKTVKAFVWDDQYVPYSDQWILKTS